MGTLSRATAQQVEAEIDTPEADQGDLDPTLMISKKDEERFLEKVDKNGPIIRLELGPCWLWTDHRDRKGYGRIKINGQTRFAHHIALELVGFIIPAEFLQVRHLCHNPPCCRPSHLKIGTSQDDADDRTSAGRQARGECHGSAKLDPTSVREIRALYQPGVRGRSCGDLAKKFGVSKPNVYRIIHGETWKHIKSTLAPEP